MVSLWGTVNTFAVIVVLVQICRRVWPWLYQNIVGPQLFGSPIKPRSMGEWASECATVFVSVCAVFRVVDRLISVVCERVEDLGVFYFSNVYGVVFILE